MQICQPYFVSNAIVGTPLGRGPHGVVVLLVVVDGRGLEQVQVVAALLHVLGLRREKSQGTVLVGNVFFKSYH